MIRATGKTVDGRNFLLLGVDAENVRRLKCHGTDYAQLNDSRAQGKSNGG